LKIEEFPFPPLLNLPPLELDPQHFEQYLFALFYEIFYLLFRAENRERLGHREGALSSPQQDLERIRLTFNSLRQEVITEEPEVIMLSVYRQRMP
jgi:F-type H+-transporting ATPase subunit gamma